MNPKVSIIIPTYNRKDMLKECLESIFSQNHAGYEVIVVDDASNDGTKDMIKNARRIYRNLRFIRNSQNMGPSYSRNRGIKASKGEIIAFTDDDCIVPNNWVDNIISAHKKLPNEFGIGGKIMSFEKSLISRFRTFQINYSLKKNKIGKKHVRYIPTCNVSYKRIAFEKVGLFDERYRYAEDIDLNIRLEKIRKPLYLDRKIIVFHRYPLAFRKFLKVSFSYGRYIPALKKKYPHLPLIVPDNLVSGLTFLLAPMASILLKITSVKGMLNKILLLHLIIADEIAYRYGILNGILSEKMV